MRMELLKTTKMRDTVPVTGPIKSRKALHHLLARARIAMLTPEVAENFTTNQLMQLLQGRLGWFCLFVSLLAAAAATP